MNMRYVEAASWGGGGEMRDLQVLRRGQTPQRDARDSVTG
jgi:hypothetical protein